jgi:TolB-like protein/tetratricopeptide (TPR) repeat protein
VTEPSHAVFLSYASQDAQAAQKICTALRAADIEVFLDQSELRGGDAWDQKIRREIHDCALFIPVISANTASRHEGYFHLEWDLADQRSHMIARSRAFVVPVCLDLTTQAAADVPESFNRVQWTRLPAGETPPAFVERIKHLLAPELSPLSARSGAAEAPRKPMRAHWWLKPAPLATLAVLLVALGYLVVSRLVLSKRGAEISAAPAAQGAPPAVSAFNPPPHSIAVLPFVNMSDDKGQEYFSDGLTEELLNSLSAINGLQVAARTSAFSFKGKDTDIGTIARKLNVGAVLEGSVRRSTHTIRITAQLINAVTGFHLWSKTYDRDIGDVLKMQTEIATSVASALQVTLLGDVAAKVELGGTSNPAAFDAYLRGAKGGSSIRDPKDLPAAIASYTEAIRWDPHYALAFAARSIALSDLAAEAETAAEVREGYNKAQMDARQALELAPDLGQAHLALAYVLDNTLQFTQANTEYERALALTPGNADLLQLSGTFASLMGHFDAGVAATRRAIVLDPLARKSHSSLGRALYFARRYQESLAAYAETISLDPDLNESYGDRGLSFYGLGDLESARTSCETKPDYWRSQQCLAVVYDKLGRHVDAEAELSKMKVAGGDTSAYQYATIYAQWGNRPKALEWLEVAWRLRDPGLEELKTDPLMDPLRQEARFQDIERALKFPS